jgi:putative endonuclease
MTFPTHRGHPAFDRRAVWRIGEDVACEHLEKLGFTILERNFRGARSEIDVVARRRRLIVFCEVKARTATRYGAPEEAVDGLKAARIRRAAGAWLAARRPGRVEVRFDVVSVLVLPDGVSVRHIPDAF